MAYDTIDITKWPQKGIALSQAIYDAVRDTQAVIQQPLPYMLLMTEDQFNELKTDPDYSPAAMSGVAIWRTPMNIMEVFIEGHEEDEPYRPPNEGIILTL